MTQTPITVTYSLEEVLVRIERKIDERFDEVDKKFEAVDKKFEELNQRIDKRFDEVDKKFEAVDKKFEAVDQKFERLYQDINDVKVGQARLEKKVEGLAKRIDNQEFVSRGVLIGLIVAIAGGAAKLFGFIGNP